MPYKITITKTEDVQTKEEPAYTIIDTRPLTTEEIREAMDDRHNFYTEALRKERLAELMKQKKEVRGYPPPRIVTKQVETKVYEQIVDTLPLGKVITAVNEPA